jgi:hypothetical protein
MTRFSTVLTLEALLECFADADGKCSEGVQLGDRP